MVSEKKLAASVEALKRGGLVVYPTETAYALGCDATNAAAVGRIYAVKGRVRGKPLATIAADVTMVENFFVVSRPAQTLARRYWPGALTLVLSVRGKKLRRALGARVGVRVSPHPVARELARHLGRPIVATSANRADGGNCYSIACVKKQLNTSMLYSIEVKRALPRRRPSTVVEIRGRKLIIHRHGPITLRYADAFSQS